MLPFLSSRLFSICALPPTFPNLLHFTRKLRRTAHSTLVRRQLDICRDLSHTHTPPAMPGPNLFLTAALESPLAVTVTIAVDVLGKCVRADVLLNIVLRSGRGL